jgi:Helix-turn-helix domain
VRVGDDDCTAQDAQLRKSVEKLIRALEHRVVDNDALSQQLVERDQTIAQLEATIAQLRAELLRHRVSPSRIGPIARTAGVLLMNAVISFSAAAGGTLAGQGLAHDSPAPRYGIEVDGHVGDEIRAAARECRSVVRLSESISGVADERALRLGRLVRQLMQEQGLTQVQVAQRSGSAGFRGGLSPSTVGRIMHDDLGTPKLETLEKLARGLGVPLSELLSVM